MVVLTFSTPAFAQHLTVGLLEAPTGTFGPGITVTDFSALAQQTGYLTAATFRWSSAPCPAAVKIKIAYQIQGFPPFSSVFRFLFLDERGPFGVLAPLQTVALVPPIKIGPGAHIGISSLTTCGGPVSGQSQPASGGSQVLQGEPTEGPLGTTTNLSVVVQRELRGSTLHSC
jgi:hypothetical protein